MKIFLLPIVAFGLLGPLSSFGSTIESQPSVSRRALICDLWQLTDNHTWGCLKPPREVSVAHGATSDEVIRSLQEQIQKLEERVRKLEK